MPNSDKRDSGGFLSTCMVSLGVPSDCMAFELGPVAMDHGGKNWRGEGVWKRAKIMIEMWERELYMLQEREQIFLNYKIVFMLV